MALTVHVDVVSAEESIFSGLAVSLLFGLFVSTVLTLVVIPVVYSLLDRTE
jgi:multidrug efflux pump subunit AcrB